MTANEMFLKAGYKPCQPFRYIEVICYYKEANLNTQYIQVEPNAVIIWSDYDIAGAEQVLDTEVLLAIVKQQEEMGRKE